MNSLLSAQHNNTMIQYTVSLGVAIYGLHGKTQEQLLRAADKALYEAKNSGRNRVVIALPCH
ncbi:diguanylate cyclase [Gloeothece verrucosa]|uniref:diguanylate cyclase n=1 Tax=Gloeothece verrucosa TaxID=2546359 RepID=UPI000302807A|nr:diguanylate cyclase [Gloeothece verrucosa]